MIRAQRPGKAVGIARNMAIKSAVSEWADRQTLAR